MNCRPTCPVRLMRDLRTLRMYFQRILKEVNQEYYIEREAMGVGPQGADQESSSDRFCDEGVVESDPGKVVINASFYFIFFPFPSVLHFPLYFSIRKHGNRERGHSQCIIT